jgi:hypothetical protein
MHDPIAYTYEADTHCPGCTAERFGTGPGGWIAEEAEDSEGNAVGALFAWDEWCEPREPGPQRLVCGTCLGTIEEHGHGPECSQCGFAIGWNGNHTAGPVCEPCARENRRMSRVGA